MLSNIARGIAFTTRSSSMSSRIFTRLTSTPWIAPTKSFFSSLISFPLVSASFSRAIPFFPDEFLSLSERRRESSWAISLWSLVYVAIIDFSQAPKKKSLSRLILHRRYLPIRSLVETTSRWDRAFSRRRAATSRLRVVIRSLLLSSLLLSSFGSVVLGSGLSRSSPYKFLTQLGFGPLLSM